MKKIALIVAGGSGSRMNSEIPKQFLVIHNKPVLVHTLEKFLTFDQNIELRLVLPEDQINYWRELCAQYNVQADIQIFRGGNTRFHSVRNGLAGIEEGDLVAIHDGVRPLVSIETIQRCFAIAEKYGAAIPVIPLAESIRKISGDSSEAVDRTQFRTIQTPQVFKSAILLDAYQQSFSELFTDDASVVEGIGQNIHLVDGNDTNIKITSPKDLLFAERFIQVQNK